MSKCSTLREAEHRSSRPTHARTLSRFVIRLSERKTIMITDDTHDVLLPERINGREALHEGTQNEEYREHPDGEMPIIGIPLPVQQGDQGPLLMADAVGAWAVERMRGRIFLIPLWPFPTHKHIYQSLWPLLQSMDGVFLPAAIQGTDWSLHWKEQEHQPGPQSWPISWEMALAQLATYIGMPVLAIADGAEKWNSALGGTRGEAARGTAHTVPTTPESWDRHTIRVRAHSKLATYIHPVIAMQDGEQKPWELAFMPGQGVEKLAPGLRSCAQPDDGSVVAFERRDGAFGLGIIGRLDWGLDQAYGTALFDAFLHACRSFDRTRQHSTAWEAARDTICATVYDLVTQNQPLIAVPQASGEEKRQRSRPLSAPLSTSLPSSNGLVGQERFRQRSHPPTKEELNRIRRQRLKTATR
jgi:gamma-glutamyl-gamma-aminobutyrate hydrolase PuuD